MNVYIVDVLEKFHRTLDIIIMKYCNFRGGRGISSKRVNFFSIGQSLKDNNCYFYFELVRRVKEKNVYLQIYFKFRSMLVCHDVSHLHKCGSYLFINLVQS